MERRLQLFSELRSDLSDAPAEIKRAFNVVLFGVTEVHYKRHTRAKDPLKAMKINATKLAGVIEKFTSSTDPEDKLRLEVAKADLNLLNYRIKNYKKD